MSIGMPSMTTDTKVSAADDVSHTRKAGQTGSHTENQAQSQADTDADSQTGRNKTYIGCQRGRQRLEFNTPLCRV